MGFRSSILAGVILIRPAIQSRNYVPGVAGWQIAADGAAEFVGLVLRGDGTEVLVVGPDTGPQVVVGSDGTSGHIEFPTNRPVADHPAAVLSVVQNAGLPQESSSFLIEGPSVNGATDRISIAIDSQSDDASTGATLRIVLNDLTQLMVIGKSDAAIHTRVGVSPPASAGTVLNVQGAPGHPGLMMQVRNSAGVGFLVDAAGDTEASGRLDVAGSAEFSSSVTVDGTISTLSDINVSGDISTSGDFFMSGVDRGRGLVDFTAINSNAPATTTTETVAITSGPVAFEDERAYEVSVRAWVQSNISGDSIQTRLRKTNASGQQLFDTFRGTVINGANSQASLSYDAIIRNVSGATINTALAVTYFRSTGTGNVFIGGNATNPSWIQIQDIGPASDYPFVNAIV